MDKACSQLESLILYSYSLVADTQPYKRLCLPIHRDGRFILLSLKPSVFVDESWASPSTLPQDRNDTVTLR